MYSGGGSRQLFWEGRWQRAKIFLLPSHRFFPYPYRFSFFSTQSFLFFFGFGEGNPPPLADTRPVLISLNWCLSAALSFSVPVKVQNYRFRHLSPNLATLVVAGYGYEGCQVAENLREVLTYYENISAHHVLRNVISVRDTGDRPRLFVRQLREGRAMLTTSYLDALEHLLSNL